MGRAYLRGRRAARVLGDTFGGRYVMGFSSGARVQGPARQVLWCARRETPGTLLSSTFAYVGAEEMG
ncbi:hypothetical protein [Sorangium sp. So ce887]|uniref:hypothetical protein n=1 Tax=Sorangium sp. So ce887 TaxID=3133324 RepID=UPI003F5F5C10